MLDIRRWIQILATVLSNAWLLFPFTRTIYQGKLKSICVPGLNCYSCPAAVGSCPLGSLQTFFANLRPSLASANYHFGLYVIGFLGLIGTLVGRMPCAWVCPFGFLQELIHKIPSPKIEISGILSWGKYLALALLVVLLPLFAVDMFGYGENWFCKYLCPAGTLEAGLPMISLQPQLRGALGWVFTLKMLILAALLLAMVFIRRPFCRTLCPLGAIYSLFNRASLFRMVHHPDNCVLCKECYRNCPMGVRFYEGGNQKDCIRCLRCMRFSCKFGAISYEVAGHAPAEKKSPAKGHHT
ncbi:MAG: 4Fe-4S binding protein [Desulfohalobiaceae bacterium]